MILNRGESMYCLCSADSAPVIQIFLKRSSYSTDKEIFLRCDVLSPSHQKALFFLCPPSKKSILKHTSFSSITQVLMSNCRLGGSTTRAGDHHSQEIIHDPTLHSAVDTYVSCVGRNREALNGGTVLRARAGEHT